MHSVTGMKSATSKLFKNTLMVVEHVHFMSSPHAAL